MFIAGFLFGFLFAIRADNKVVYHAEKVIIQWRGHVLWVRRAA